ncbi:MAG: excinuclease ABC subunit UvrC [Prevotellaceae bacterium]|jgi:excinuclease ABC subunit C|nr:excinuclease ABC subunit UvrC [Prevotellaceae bacterium]
MESNDILKSKVGFLPSSPGVYQFFDDTGKIIYVGKAKDLKKRVSTYFTSRTYDNRKLMVMVSKIADIKHIVVDTGADALLLENNLIKEYQPRYNVLLKDDKTYPWICIKSEPFPRVFSTRRVVKDGSKYFGPYASLVLMKTLLELVRQLYPLRTCNFNLEPEAIAKGKYKECLEYHIGNCKAPCIGKQTIEDYDLNIKMITSIIRGNIGEVMEFLKEQMKKTADLHRFEDAHRLKMKYEILERYRSKSVIVNPTINNVDVFSLLPDTGVMYANFMRVISGAIVQSHTAELKLGVEDSKESLLSYLIAEMYERHHGLSKELIVPFMPDQEMDGYVYTIPQRGDKHKLLELSERNSKFYRMERLKQLEKVNPEQHSIRILTQVQKDLHLDQPPVHMECFDNSNIRGAHPVAACVVFKNAKPSKKDYRHFNIKTVEGPDDFASMREIIYRRYSRMLTEGDELPQLIIIDGGKGQLSAVVSSLELLGLYGKIPVIGLAKRLEEIYFPYDSVPLFLDKNSESLKLIMRMRDEVHRFGITFHRNKRSAAFIKSELTNIPGVGETTAKKLLSHYKSIPKIAKANLEELTKLVGKKMAEKVVAYFKLKEER